jgi:UDP-2,4-diacetamido-2,4,6-trideoxy-beta-L-altropyranose hydrolase
VGRKIKKKLLIRVDAYSAIGTGHLMRCIALAGGWKQAGGKALFVIYSESEKLIGRIRKEGFPVRPLDRPGKMRETLRIIKDEDPDWIALDGYHFDSKYQKAIKEKNFKLLVIDDYAHLPHYYADIILNQNYGAEKFSYVKEPYTRLLLGTDYVLLRKEFLKYRGHKRAIPDIAKKLLITLGGADPGNHTLKVMRAVNLIERPLRVKVVVGASNPNFDSIKTEAGRGRHKIEILKGVEDMAPLMAWADVAVSAGGTTVWELAFMGVPTLLCIVAENQEGAVNTLAKSGFPSAGWVKQADFKDISEALKQVLYNKVMRKSISEKGKSIVDGLGANRTVTEMTKRP